MSRQVVKLMALEGVPEILPGDSLADITAAALRTNDVPLANHDIVAVCQKIVSKAEDRYVDLAHVTPSSRAKELGQVSNKDPRLVEVILGESTQVVRCARDVLIVRHRLGFVVANAGVDQSNISGGDRVLLLPENPDHSAEQLRAALAATFGVDVAVIVTDSFGRPWRLGVVGTCIGCAGLNPLLDRRGQPDRFGRALQITQIAAADEIAAMATLVMGEAAEGTPMAIVSGIPSEYFADPQPAKHLLRPIEQDLFK